jgi:hypothetical protein
MQACAMRVVVRSLLLLSLAGCVATPAPPPRLHGPDYFGERTQPDMVLGYFVEPHLLGVKGCLDFMSEEDPESPAYGHCLGPHPTVTLVVEDVIFGHLEQARWKLSLTDSEKSASMPIGRRYRVLAYPERHGTLNARAYQRLFRTRQGEWAVPVGADVDRPGLPCSAEAMLSPHPVEFARPYPTRSLGKYEPEDLEQLRKNPQVTIRGDVVHYRAGVLLSEIYALRDRIPSLDASERWRVDACLRR